MSPSWARRAVAVDGRCRRRAMVDLDAGAADADRRHLRSRDRGRWVLPDRDAAGQQPDPRRQLHPFARGRTGDARRLPAARRRRRAGVRAARCRRRSRCARRHAFGRRPAGGQIGLVACPHDPNRPAPSRRHAVCRGRRGASRWKTRSMLQGFLEEVERQPRRRDRPHDRGAARLRDGPELPGPRGRAHPRRDPDPRADRRATDACPADRRHRHERPADAGRGHFEQPRQHVDHRLQRPPRRVRRPALPADDAPRHDHRQRRHGAADRRAARPRRAARGGVGAGAAGHAVGDRRRSRPRDRGAGLSRGDAAVRRVRLYPRRRAEAQRPTG